MYVHKECWFDGISRVDAALALGATERTVRKSRLIYTESRPFLVESIPITMPRPRGNNGRQVA